MLGIAVLFFLGLWVFITVWAIRFGWRWGKSRPDQSWRKWLGALLGFFVTFGWFVTLEGYRFTREQIWVSKFCRENPRLKIYITPEQFAEIIRTGDASLYYQSQPKYKIINEQYIEISGELFQIDSTYKDNKIKSYSKAGRHGNTSYRKRYFAFHPYRLIIFGYSEADSHASRFLGLDEWYNLIQDCELNSNEFELRKEYTNLFNSIEENR